MITYCYFGELMSAGKNQHKIINFGSAGKIIRIIIIYLVLV